MNKHIRTVFILVFLIVIPFLIYGLFQVNSLKEDEIIAENIYNRQMETMLFSLNMYADDRMDRWVRKLSNEQNSIEVNAHNLLANNESIQAINIREISSNKDALCLNQYIPDSLPSMNPQIATWYTNEKAAIDQLELYLESGYQKIKAASDWSSIDGLEPNQSAITVMLYDKDSTLYNALFILETQYWASQILGPKMEELSQYNFRLAVAQNSETSDALNTIYDTEEIDWNSDYTSDEFWIIEGNHLVIQSIGLSFRELIRSRGKVNLYMLAASISIMIIGTFLMLRNIRNTMKLAQLKSDFVSNVSHEIRTPLSLIRMYAETLMLDRLPNEERKKHYYNIIHHESGRLTYLVNNILDFSKIEANKKSYSKSNHDMNDLVNSLLDSYSYLLEEKKASCTTSLSKNEIPIYVDNQAFEEALSNLLENAIKYSKDSISITVKTYSNDKYGFCSIEDQGVGISKSAQKHIFDKFYRVESALTQKTKGAGLGLSLVQHIMQAHDGAISMTSTLEKGSIFTLKFPLTSNRTYD